MGVGFGVEKGWVAWRVGEAGCRLRKGSDWVEGGLGFAGFRRGRSFLQRRGLEWWFRLALPLRKSLRLVLEIRGLLSSPPILHCFLCYELPRWYNADPRCGAMGR